MSDLARRIEAVLIENPFATSRQIADCLGVTSGTIRTSVKYRLGMTFSELRAEVFEGYWQRIPEDAS